MLFKQKATNLSNVQNYGNLRIKKQKKTLTKFYIFRKFNQIKFLEFLAHFKFHFKQWRAKLGLTFSNNSSTRKASNERQ